MSAAIIAAAELVKALARATPEEREQAIAIVKASLPKSDRRVEAGRANGAKRQRGNTSSLPPLLPGNAPGNGAGKSEVITKQNGGNGQVMPEKGAGGFSGSSDFSSPSEQIQKEPDQGNRARELSPDCLNSTSSLPPPPEDANEDWGLGVHPATGERSNPTALVDMFIDGVNRKVGGTWTVATGKPYGDLARALQVHLDKHRRDSPLFTPMAFLRELGGRWVAYCEGEPEGAFQARDWLGKGAPAEKRQSSVRRARALQPVPEGAEWMREGHGEIDIPRAVKGGGT